MIRCLKGWHEIKRRGENIGGVFLILGVAVLLVQFGLVLYGLRTETGLLGTSLGLISVGLGFIAIGMSTKSDEKHTDLLKRLDKNVACLPRIFKGDVLTQWGQQFAEETISDQSKIAAQKRLDEDTKKVGFVRGKVYKLEDGNWGIAWGGEYPL